MARLTPPTPRTVATGDRVRVVAGTYRGRAGRVALAAYQPAAILVSLDGCPVPLAFGASELAPTSDHRGRGPIDVPRKELVP